VFAAAYLLSRRAELLRRSGRSWEAILEKLRPGLSKSTDAEAAADLDKRFTNGTIEQRALTAQGRRTIFREAGVMMEMADYAERNGDQEVAPVVANLRGHAAAIRAATAKDVLRIPKRDD